MQSKYRIALCAVGLLMTLAGLERLLSRPDVDLPQDIDLFAARMARPFDAPVAALPRRPAAPAVPVQVNITKVVLDAPVSTAGRTGVEYAVAGKIQPVPNRPAIVEATASVLPQRDQPVWLERMSSQIAGQEPLRRNATPWFDRDIPPNFSISTVSTPLPGVVATPRVINVEQPSETGQPGTPIAPPSVVNAPTTPKVPLPSPSNTPVSNGNSERPAQVVADNPAPVLNHPASNNQTQTPVGGEPVAQLPPTQTDPGASPVVSPPVSSPPPVNVPDPITPIAGQPPSTPVTPPVVTPPVVIPPPAASSSGQAVSQVVREIKETAGFPKEQPPGQLVSRAVNEFLASVNKDSSKRPGSTTVQTTIQSSSGGANPSTDVVTGSTKVHDNGSNSAASGAPGQSVAAAVHEAIADNVHSNQAPPAIIGTTASIFAHQIKTTREGNDSSSNGQGHKVGRPTIEMLAMSVTTIPATVSLPGTSELSIAGGPEIRFADPSPFQFSSPLMITAVPEPATALLTLLSLGALALPRRRSCL